LVYGWITPRGHGAVTVELRSRLDIWRVAEFHDGRYGSNLESSGGWSFWTHGYLPGNTRFWATINDQPATPWN